MSALSAEDATVLVEMVIDVIDAFQVVHTEAELEAARNHAATALGDVFHEESTPKRADPQLEFYQAISDVLLRGETQTTIQITHREDDIYIATTTESLDCAPALSVTVKPRPARRTEQDLQKLRDVFRYLRAHDFDPTEPYRTVDLTVSESEGVEFDLRISKTQQDYYQSNPFPHTV